MKWDSHLSTHKSGIFSSSLLLQEKSMSFLRLSVPYHLPLCPPHMPASLALPFLPYPAPRQRLSCLSRSPMTSMLPDASITDSNFGVHLNYPGIWIKCGLWLRGSGVGLAILHFFKLSGDARVAGLRPTLWVALPTIFLSNIEPLYRDQ